MKDINNHCRIGFLRFLKLTILLSFITIPISLFSPTSGLSAPYQQDPGSDIPWIEAILIKTVIPAAGYVGNVCGCRSQSPEPMGVLHEIVHALHELLEVCEIGIWKPSGNKGLPHAGYPAYLYGISIKPGTPSFPGIKILIQAKFIYNSGNRNFLFDECHTDGKRKNRSC